MKWRAGLLAVVLPLGLILGGRAVAFGEFTPVTRAHLAETIAMRYEPLSKEFIEGKWEARKPADQCRFVSVMSLHAALQSQFNDDADALKLLDDSMSYALEHLWSGSVMVNGHEYLDNAMWASLVGASLLVAGDAVGEETRETMMLTVRGAAGLCRNRATGYAPTNVFVSNQDAWAANGLLRAFQCLGEEGFRDAARSKFLAILERQQQGFWSENGVGPLYQSVGMSPFSELATALFEDLTYAEREAVMDIALSPCVIRTSAEPGGYELGLEAARSSGFRGPAGLTSYCLDIALRQRNPFVLRGALDHYHDGLRNIKWHWGLHDPVTAHFLYAFARAGEIASGETDSWRFSWAAKARIVALKDGPICDEQSYIRSATGLVAHFADRRLSGRAADVQFNPGGLRTLARGHEVIVAPDTLSRPRFLVGDEPPGETGYIGSRVRRGVYASGYELLQRIHGEAGEAAGSVRQTFCVVGEWLVIRTRSRSPATEYAITHPDSADEVLADGRAVVSRLKQSVSGKQPGAHAMISLDGAPVAGRDSDLQPFPGTAVKMPLDEWIAPSSGGQMRYVAVLAQADAEGVAAVLESIRPATTINGKPPDPRNAGGAYAVALPTRDGGTCYVIFANHGFAAEAMTVAFDEHEFRLLDTDRQAISVFGFDRSGRLEGFAASARRLFVDGEEMFCAPGTAYVSCIMPADGPWYASADCGAAQLRLAFAPCRSLVTGEDLDAPRLRAGEIVVRIPQQ